MWKPANAPPPLLLLTSFCRLVINPRIMSIPGSFGKYQYIRLMRAAYILQNVISCQMLYPAHCRKNVPLHLALQPRKILFYKIAPSQMTVNKIILNYLQFQIIFFCTQKSISNAGPPSERCSYRRVRLRFDQIANASNAESADNAKHLCNNNVSASEPRPFLRFSFLTVVVQPVRKYVVKSRGSRLICFPRQVLWQIRRATNALSFQLLTLIAAYWLRIGPIVRPYQPPFSIFIISF